MLAVLLRRREILMFLFYVHTVDRVSHGWQEADAVQYSAWLRFINSMDIAHSGGSKYIY